MHDTSGGATSYAKGSRLLVSGERSGVGDHPADLLARTSGFTRSYGPAEANLWETAFR
jgi:hypothetical protein